jgi:zinc transport system substrate-binding protein
VVAAVLYNKELASGMEENAADSEENHWNGANPHLFMEPEGGILIAESIAAQLCAVDPGNSEIYLSNLEEIENRLRSIIECNTDLKQNISGKKVILMNEVCVYIAQELGLDVEKYVFRDSGEAYFDYELEKVLSELEKCESRVILIEKQAPERFCEALERAGFVLTKIDTMSAKQANEGFEGYLDALTENAEVVAAKIEAMN